MLKIKVLTIGKCKEEWLELAIADYTRRLSHQLSIEWILAKDDAQLIALVQKENHFIALDVKGRSVSSEEFAKLLEKARLTFVIGGSDGLPAPIVEQAAARISLSALTFTHQLTRLILLEQLYRGCEILKGSPYHK